MTRKVFSPSYEKFLQKVLKKGSAEIPLASARAARNLRSEFYHYRAYLKESNPSFYEEVKALKFKVHPHKLEVAFPTAPNTADIQRALDSQGD